MPCRPRALLLAVVVASAARADSPLTSIDLSQGYEDLPVVQAARRLPPGSESPKEALAFLTSSAPSDQQAAVLFALSQAGALQPGLLVEHLAQRHRVPAPRLTARDLSPRERFLLGTALALSDWSPEQAGPGEPPLLGTPALRLLDEAASALPADFAVHYVRALVQAQGLLSTDACAVFRTPDAVLRRFPPARRTLRPGALRSAAEYLALYEADCPGSAAAARAALQGLNEVYAVALGDDALVTATQAGAVAWQGTPLRPVASVAAELCTSAVVLAGAPVVACQAQLYRWDGARFEPLAALGGRLTGQPQVLVGPSGALWVREGHVTRRWNEAARRLERVEAPWPTDAYQVALAPNGAAWWTRFMQGLGSTGGEFALQSREYPGSDPRRVTLTADGTVWVEDFERGLLRFDEAAWRFVREPLISAKASGVAWDGARQRFLALEYDRGLAAQRRDGEPLRVDLSRFEYLRSLALAPSGEVWVASTKGLLKLTERDSRWTVQAFTVEARPPERRRR